MNACQQINTLSDSDFVAQLKRLERQVRVGREYLSSTGFLRDCSPMDPPLPTGLPVHFVVGDFAVTDLTRIHKDHETS
jgi:hypothetical protein